MSITDQEFIDQKNAQLHEYRETISTLTAKVKRYETALEFYADRWTYYQRMSNGVRRIKSASIIENQDFSIDEIRDDPEKGDRHNFKCAGRRARAALNQGEGK